MEASEVVGFWRDAGPSKWFKRDAAFDAGFSRRFEQAHHAASRRELEGWLKTGDGALALQILLDQFPRNHFRDSAHAYATDGLALHYAQRSIAAGVDQQVDPGLRVFMYLAFEHAEVLDHQNRAVSLIEPLGNAESTRYAQLHRDIIVRFGRFPHRNPHLGRESTGAEREFLAQGGFSG